MRYITDTLGGKVSQPITGLVFMSENTSRATNAAHKPAITQLNWLYTSYRDNLLPAN